jgi:signal transduction histidine kinase
MGCLLVLFNVLGLAALGGLTALIARGLGLVDFSFDLGQWFIPIGVGVLLFVMLLVGLGGAGVRRVVVPLDDLLAAAERIGQGEYTVRVEEKGPREVRSMARVLNKMARRLDELDSRRRDLLADVTHELRTPLTVVQGNLEGMLDGVYPADEANLRSLLEETKLLSRLVEELRTLALAESGALQLRKEPVDLSLLVSETTAAFQAQADAAGIVLKVDTAKDLPTLPLDGGRIRQVLSNLLANALRYTPEGGRVTVSCQQSGESVLLGVQDSGPGIPAEELPHIFDRFHKSTDEGGMGLGLAIARHLVEAHGGRICAESQPGQGTTMRVELPVED